MKRSGVFVALDILLVAAAAAGIWFLAIEPLAVSRQLTAVEVRTRRATEAGAITAAPVARDNMAMLRRIMKTAPASVDAYMLLSMNAHLLGRYEDSIRYLDIALTINPRPEIYLNRAYSYVELGQLDKATEDYARAVRFNPQYIDSVSEPMRARVAAAAGVE